MPTFRQPEWQQNADRHTELIDPVLTVRQLSRFEFNLKSYVRIDHALVFATAKGGYEAYLPPRRPTRGEIATNRYTAVYEVDMGVHPHTAELPLPSDNDAFEFTAQVDLSWQVLDPARFVASGHRDVPGLLLGELQQAARPVTRRFAIADSAAAEREMLDAMSLLGPLGAPAGLQVTWTVRLRRDQENIDHQRRLQAIDHSAEEQIRVAQRGSDIDVEADRRGRQQDALQLDRAMAYGVQQQELLLQQQRWQHEQAMQQGRQMVELQQIEAEKIAFYQWHLQQGGVHAWALHLAQHPEDSRLVMQSMRDDQLRMIQAQMDLVKQLLSSEAAENWELEGPKQLALRTVHDILNQRMPGVAQQELPEGDAYPGTPGVAPGQGMPQTPGTGPGMPGTVEGQVVPGQPYAGLGGVPGQPYPGTAAAEPGAPSGTTEPFPEPGRPVSGPMAPTVPLPPGPPSPYPGSPMPAPTPPPGAPYSPPGPYGTQAAAWQPPTPHAPPGAQTPYPGAPAPSPGPQPPTPHAPPPGTQTLYPGAPTPYPSPQPPPPATPGTPPWQPPQAPTSGPTPPPAPTPTATPPWQPPPGYGHTPTLPATDVPDSAPSTEAGTDTGARPNGPEASGT
ncbi:hypothetical protein [Streptomyces sp. NBC_00140]|uniref:hypothetical protein n=1 Tax=Streptomyces sp. NBC_00140 TaxID=2975664 RepID=UPI0022581E94|nr:hypothetical protein [Streptomyces sp. NBC_00140]MCX5332063.1 hypothetical protein [Streptomyces sp. NBC_00140]